jgi:hypothetical protein
MKRTFLIFLLVVAVFIVGCSNDGEGRGDGPVGRYDDSPAYIINMPDSFMNVAIKCDPAGYRIYTHTREAAPVVIADESCVGKSGVPEAYRTMGKATGVGEGG